jgi:hypothetical protein
MSDAEKVSTSATTKERGKGQVRWGVVISALIGAVVMSVVVAVVIVVLTLLGKLNDLKTIDMLSFAVAVVGLIITALLVLGAFAVVGTWNDIETRARRLMEQYRQEAKAEIDRNASERQAAINDLGGRWERQATGFNERFTRNSRVFMGAELALLAALAAVFLWIVRYVRRLEAH